MLTALATTLRRSRAPAARMFSPTATVQHGKSDEQIANEGLGAMLPITEIADRMGIPNEVLEVRAATACRRAAPRRARPRARALTAPRSPPPCRMPL